MRLFALVALAALLASPAVAQAVPPTGQGVTIAVLDTGVDSSHPELAGRVERESFAEPGLPIPLPLTPELPVAEDPHGQGTAVASVAAGATLGLAPEARILDLQVSAKYTGVDAIDPVTEAAAIEAMDALLRDAGRAQVVLLSFAQAGVSEAGGQTLASQARSLWDAGVLVVVPTGPTANPLSASAHVLTVAGREACPPNQGGAKPDLVAQGQDVPAATPGNGLQPGGTAPQDGTALAAAKVAGAAALLREANPALPVDALAAFLRDAAVDRGAPGLDECSGFGELDAANAVAWARMWRDPLVRVEGKDAAGAGALLAIAAVACASAMLARGRRHG